MYKRMIFTMAVLGLSLVLMEGRAMAYPPGYWENYSSRFPNAVKQEAATHRAMNWGTSEASWLIGQQVNGRAGNYLGQISDLVIDQANNRVALVVLSDVPGFGNDQVAIPYGCLRRSGRHTFTVRFPTMAGAPVNTREDPDLTLLRQYPADSPLYSIPQPIDPNWVAEVYRTYGQSPYWTEKGERELVAINLYRGTDMISARVESSQGKAEARIADFIIDSRSGQISLLVLSDVKGRGENRVAVPFGAVDRTGKGIFALRGTKDELASAPIYQESDMRSRGYAARVYRHFGLQPPWREAGKARGMDPYRWGGEGQDF